MMTRAKIKYTKLQFDYDTSRKLSTPLLYSNNMCNVKYYIFKPYLQTFLSKKTVVYLLNFISRY